ncbi:hypothetical protein B0T20DRAFT_390704 [Sordaria brevicollis]|uniref:SMP-30/Gluconolactonase/LRE-like region domain-containing protein n=1 Tax=Sordaria brevicollis TaxID=83679 RepID=A0AAE0PJA0_SORBR|nr:hypothetical protein B0T20DRAFT_390704 [Sordaria brevicollis]
MPSLTTLLLMALGLTTTTLSSPLPAPDGTLSARQSAASQIVRLSSIENLAIRSSGLILATNMNSPSLISIDPLTKTSSTALSISGTSGLSGIVEFAPDIFAVIGGKSIYRVDFTSSPPKSTLIKTISEAGNLNGLSTFTNDSVLVGDAGKGVVYRLDISTAKYEQVIKDATMAPSGSIPFGIDGLRYRASDSTLWYTNIFKNSFHKLVLDPVTGKATGAVTTLWTNLMGDDLCFGPGEVYVATNSRNSLVEVDTSQQKPSPKSVATVSGSTACAVGRGRGIGGWCINHFACSSLPREMRGTLLSIGPVFTCIGTPRPFPGILRLWWEVENFDIPSLNQPEEAPSHASHTLLVCTTSTCSTHEANAKEGDEMAIGRWVGTRRLGVGAMAIGGPYTLLFIRQFLI